MLPAVRGVIDRRILANHFVDPDALDNVLPGPYELQSVGSVLDSVQKASTFTMKRRAPPPRASIQMDGSTDRNRSPVEYPTPYSAELSWPKSLKSDNRPHHPQ